MARAGWVNVDRFAVPGIDVIADLRAGLPLPPASVAWAVAMHVLQDLHYLDIIPALGEVRRVLAPGGILRAGVPDLERGIQAFLRDDRGYFYVPDEEVCSAGAKLVVQAIWYGSVRTPFTWDFAREMCAKAGFRTIHRAAFGRSVTGGAEITRLDNRERETLFFEAVACVTMPCSAWGISLPRIPAPPS
jgi:predicted SAM-dependent methyltransferase